jgi:hypothetical protein
VVTTVADGSAPIEAQAGLGRHLGKFSTTMLVVCVDHLFIFLSLQSISDKIITKKQRTYHWNWNIQYVSSAS